MSIRPPSDIVLDVARAADPERLAAATSRLQTFALNKSGGPAFQDVAEGVGRTKTAEGARKAVPAAPLDPSMVLARLSDTGAHRRVDDKASPHAPFRQFEAVVLRSFVESMMPPKSEAVFGRGTAGQIWKGLLADEIGSAMARSGGLGIAKQVASVHGAKTAAADGRLFESLWQTRVAAPKAG
jgi:hypothetical protein